MDTNEPIIDIQSIELQNKVNMDRLDQLVLEELKPTKPFSCTKNTL